MTMTENRSSIVEYIKSGIKECPEDNRLGVELEHFITDETGYAIPYAGAQGIGTLLEELSAEYDERIYSDSGDLIGLTRERAALSLEPAAQLELSAGPYEEVGLIRYDFEEFQRDLAKVLDARGQRTMIMGYQPVAKVDDLTLIPKARYRYMDAHFQKIGPYGRYMMRGSASTQISIDFNSVDDCLRKLRLTSAASPLFALVCDNSAIFEGKPSPHELMRTEIWRECDSARCGLIPGVLSDTFTLEDYANYVLNTPAILVKDEKGQIIPTEKTFAELYRDKPMSKTDIEHALSMLFNDVRLKTYIEIRTADAVPVPFVTAYAALIKGLFYSADNLDKLDKLFDSVTEDDVAEAKIALMDSGYDAVVYGESAGDILDHLFELAYNALAKNERSYLSALRQLVSTRATLASVLRK